jgi:phosphate transport system permease protein
VSFSAEHPLATGSMSRGRRAKDVIARGLVACLTAVAVIPLLLLLYYVIKKGAGSISWSFFTTDPTGNFLGNQGGIRSAIVGTIEIVALATAISVPLGVGLALYLVEFGKASRFAQVVRYFVDVLTGVPSVVFGLFVYTVLVLGNVGGAGFAGWKGSVALALLMLPIVTRAAEVALSLVPNSMREAALALGAPRWRVVFRVVLPTAFPGLITGVLLAVARAAGETAPLLFTAFGANAIATSLTGPTNTLPLQIFKDVQNPNPALVARAWGGALTLIALILLVTIAARIVASRSRLR